MAFTDINYFIIHSKTSNNDVAMYVTTTIAISQVSTTVPALIWQDYRYKGIDYTTMNSNCYNEIRGTLSPQPYCSSSQLSLYESNKGLLCENENSDTTLKIYNINGLNSGSRYYIQVRLLTELSTGGTVAPQVTIETYYTVDVDYSVVDRRSNHGINTTYTNYYTTPQ